MGSKRTARIVSVGGGKGGVGKSVVAANLGVAMAQSGARVIIVDADLGSANQHTLFGIDRPGPTLQALFDHTIDSLDKALVPTSISGLQIVPGSGAVVGAANINYSQKLMLIRHIRALDADVVLIDVGAGVSYNVLDLFDAADLRVVVATPQLTSVQNAYGFVKGAVFRELARLATTPAQAAMVEDSPEAAQATRRVPELVTRIRAADKAFGDRVAYALARFGSRLVGNQIYDPQDRGVLFALSRMVHDFLGAEAPVLGCLRASRKVHDSVGARRPFLLDAVGEESAVALREIARSVLADDLALLRRAREQAESKDFSASKLPEVEGLPAPLAEYQRAQERKPVECAASLMFSSGTLPVTIRDISAGGALLEMAGRLPAVSTRALLIVTALEDRPSLTCSVRHSTPDKGRVGVEFSGDKQLAQRVAAELAARFQPKGDAPTS